jgi:WD40 repeat protein
MEKTVMWRTAAILWMSIFFCCPLAALAQTVNCGEQPKELPPDVQERIKGDVEGKAQLFTKLLGSAQLKGTVEASKTELQQKYKDVDKAQMDRYMSWVSCQSIMQDKDLTTLQKNKLWLDLYREIIGVKKEKQSDATNSITTESGVIAVKYPKLRNAEFEPTYWASLADKVRIAKSGETKVLATLDCNPNGGLSGMALSISNPPVVAVSCTNELRLTNVLTAEVFKFVIGPAKSGPISELLEFGLGYIVSKHVSDPCLLVWGFFNPQDVASVKLLYKMECSSTVRSIAFHEKYGFLGVGLADGTIEIWRLAEKAPEKLFSQKFNRAFDQPFQHNYIEDIEFTGANYSGPGFKLIAHTWGNVAYVIDMSDMLHPSVTTIEYPATDKVIFTSRMSANGKLLAFGTSDGAVTVWDVAARKLVAKYLHDDQVFSVDFGSSDDIVISTGLDKFVKTFRISANAVVDTLNLGRESIALQVNYGGRRFAVGQGTRANATGPFYAGEWRLNPGGKISSIIDQ